MAPEIVQANETDPWGWEIKALGYSNAPSQNYVFQKQERISDFDLNINWFKYRPFYGDIGRGLQVDRLAEKYSYNSPFAFSENKVTAHIELDGLEAVAIIGGADIDSKGLSKTMLEIQNQIIKSNPKSNIQTFNTDPLNLGGVETQVVNFVKEKTVDNSGPVIIYGYSLGGIVATSAANTLKESDKKVDMLVTVDAAAGPASQTLNIPENVYTNVNFFQPNSSSIGSRGYENKAIDSQKTSVININVEQIARPSLKINHRNMDEVTSKAVSSLINRTLKSQ